MSKAGIQHGGGEGKGGKVETYVFQAEIAQLMSLIMNTIYSNKEIFLRELISNASDALNKIRCKSLTDSSALDSGEDLHIKIIPNKQDRTLTVLDNGIGMTKTDLINNLGMIAHSGTKEFMETLQDGSDISMIGQFGVGFYSAYMVADKVTVSSKHDDDKQYVWESSAGGFYTVKLDCGEKLVRGTKLVLHLKMDQTGFLDEAKIKEIVRKYSQFIVFPIILVMERERVKEVNDASMSTVPVKRNTTSWKKRNRNKRKKAKMAEMKPVMEKYIEEEVLNTVKPIWTRNPKEVSQEEYTDFYKSLTSSLEDHLAVKHFSVEGQLEFSAILFVPRRASIGFYGDMNKVNNVRLYLRKIFIIDNCSDIIPRYLNFITAIVDSEDLPLNVSREVLQQTRILKVICKNLEKKCLELFEELTEDKGKYMMFYKQFGKNLKIGILEGNHVDKVTELLRYHTSVSGDEMCSLKDYIGRMKGNQKLIYYITGENRQQLANSPYTEMMRKKGLEVIYMTENIDEFVVTKLRKYQNKVMVCLTKEGLDLPEDMQDLVKYNLDCYHFKPLCAAMMAILGNEVERVIVSKKLVDSPCCVVTPHYGITANEDRLRKVKVIQDMSEEQFESVTKVLEINPDHPILQTLQFKMEFENFNGETFAIIVTLLFRAALLVAGFTLDEPHAHVGLICQMMKVAKGSDEEYYSTVRECELHMEMLNLKSCIDDTVDIEEVD